MNVGRAVFAGMVGALVMSLLGVMLQAAGVPLHMEQWLAAALGTHTWLIGFLAHLLLGGLIGLGYAVVFEWIIDSSGVGQGILLGAINTIFAGFGWAMIGGPGVFWSALGPAGVASLFLVHVVYGGVVGGLYRLQHVRAYY